jgi:hypothetical protein
MQAHNDADSSRYAAFDQRDATANTTWALLFWNNYGSSSGSGSSGKHNALLTRLPDEHELRARQ